MGLDAQYFIFEPPLDQLAPAGGFVFLLNVDFRTMPDDSSPPATIVGKEGAVEVTDTGGNGAILGGAYVITGTAAERDPKLLDIIRTRTAGLMAGWKAKQNDTNGFYAALIDSTNRYARHALSNVQDYFAGYKGIIGTATANVEHDFVFVLRTRGAYLFVDGVLFRVWDVGTETLQAMFAARNNATAISLYVMRVVDAMANGYAELGQRDLDVTAALAAPAVGNTGVMTPDAVITFDVSAPTGVTTVLVRYVDANNYDQISIDAAGELTYGEVVGGAAVNNLITAAGVISGGEKVSAVINGGDVGLFHDDTSAGTTSAATNNTTGTVLELDVEADAVTNLEARTLDGTANVGSGNHPGYGLATAVLPGPRAAADTFTHEANTRISWHQVKDNTGGTAEFKFRVQDATNFWSVKIPAAGKLMLYETVAGVATLRAATSDGASVDDVQMTLELDDETITLYKDNTLQWSYSSAANFKTETSGEILSIGGDGEYSDLITHPRDYDDAPNTPGASKISAAIAAMGA